MGANRHPGGDSPGPSPAKPRRAADLLARLRRATDDEEGLEDAPAGAAHQVITAPPADEEADQPPAHVDRIEGAGHTVKMPPPSTGCPNRSLKWTSRTPGVVRPGVCVTVTLSGPGVRTWVNERSGVPRCSCGPSGCSSTTEVMSHPSDTWMLAV